MSYPAYMVMHLTFQKVTTILPAGHPHAEHYKDEPTFPYYLKDQGTRTLIHQN